MARVSLLRRAALAVLLLLSIAPNSFSHPKTDIVVLLNGDRITGEITALAGGRLSVSTDAMGTLGIEWKDIASIDSDYKYELRLSDGKRLFGSLQPAAEPNRLLFEDVFGDDKLLVSRDVVELRPVEASLEDRLDIYLSANYAFTKASGVTQTEFRANVSYEDEDTLNSLTSRLTISDTDTQSTSSSRVTLSRKVWTDRESVYRQAFVGYETNDELSLDYRVTLGAGLGRYFIDSNQQSFVGSVGLQALEERSVGGDTEESLEAVLTLGYSRWRFDSPKLNLILDSSLYPSLTESGRIRADANATLRWEIVNDLFWDFSSWGSYDSSAVEETAGEFDWGVTTGLGWDF